MERSMVRSLSLLVTVTSMIIGLLVGAAELASGQTCKPASEGGLRNIAGTYDNRVWNTTQFRSDVDKKYFKVWPEYIGHPRFRFFCQDATSNYSLADFTKTCDQTTGRLDPRPYYDVGVANDLGPYYKHWKYADQVIPPTFVPLFCERSDMERLYSDRIWRKTIIPAVVTTLAIITILEFVAIVCGLVMYWWAPGKYAFPDAWLIWFSGLGIGDTACDCAHLLMLVVAGFCMIEGVSHSSTTSWRSTCMLDAGVIYTYLTLFAFISSFLRQVACACSHLMEETRAVSIIGNRVLPARNEHQHFMLETEGCGWRWQRVFNQFAVVMIMTAFLSFNENLDGTAMDSLVSVIWTVVVVAATWSIGVSIVIGARAAIVIVGELWWPALIRRSPRWP